MAKTLEQLLIKLKVDGVEGVTQLKGSLRQLSQATKFSDKDVEKLTNGIRNYSRVAGASEKVIKGQISALKGLREQVQIGSKAYKDLTSDIERYEKRLNSLGNTSESTGQKLLTFNQALSQFPGRKPAAFSAQIAALNKELANTKVNTDAYLLQLRRIQEKERDFQQAVNRQAVIARSRSAVEDPIDLRSAIGNVGELPKTTAALQLRISELQDSLKDLDFTSSKYADTQREILGIERQLNEVASRRVEAIKGVTEQQRRAEQLVERSRGRKQRLLSNQAATNAEYDAALAAHIASPAMPTRELSNLYQSIGQISTAGMAREIEMMGNSYSKVAADIKQASLAGNKSVSSLQAQKLAFTNLRNVLDPTSREFRKVSKEILLIDRRLNKLNVSTSKFSKANILQGAGAIASASIFGGPLGALGSILGFAAGGPGGAAVGGGLGASANILVDYAAQIAQLNTQLNLAKQTLALASTGQQEYNTLLDIARNISRDYAVGLKETIGGFSQVAVAARANNLTLEETETIYRGLVSAGIAFGKSQQDIDAIVRATVQVLSKGKLSAEELQGQIGERLPGAVAKFAEATNRTLPQLAKDLKAGTVEISDFVDFSRQNLLDYDKVAQLIGDAPEKAGARLKIALEEAAENYGGFFQRTGAGIQDLGTIFLNFLNDNQENIQNFVVDSIIAFKNLAQQIRLAIEDIKEAFGILAPVMDLFVEGVNTIANFRRRQAALKAGGFDDAQARKDAEERVSKYYSPIFQPFNFQREFRLDLNRQKGAAVQRGERSMREEIGDTIQGRAQLMEQIFGDFKPYAYGQPPKPTSNEDPDDPNDPSNLGSGRRPMTKEEFGLAIAIAKAKEDGNKLLEIRKTLELDLLKISLDQVGGYEQLLDIFEANNNARQGEAAVIKKVQDDFKKDLDSITKSLNDQNEGLQEELNTRKQVERLIAEGINPELAKQLVQIDQIAAKEQESLNKVIAGIETQLEQVGLDEKLKTILQEQLDIIIKTKVERGEVVKTTKDVVTELNKEQTFFENLQDAIEATQTKIKELIDPLQQITGAAQAMGTAFSESFKGVIDGSMTGTEALKGFFQSIADHFSNMAAEIAAEAIKLAALQFVKFIINSMGGGSSSKSPLPDSMYTAAANGMAFAQNKIVPYAMGGVVNKPTLFQFANGGAGRLGLMGEAGPEAILPLSRGANGKLGVEAHSGGVGNIVVNVDATGSQAQGDEPRANMLGKLLGAAVQSELIKQKRPGGLLAS